MKYDKKCSPRGLEHLSSNSQYKAQEQSLLTNPMFCVKVRVMSSCSQHHRHKNHCPGDA